MNKLSIKIAVVLTLINTSTFTMKKTQKTTNTSWPAPVTRRTRCKLPENLTAEAEKTKMFLITPKPEDLPVLYQNYPDGLLFFPDDRNLAQKFNTVITLIKANPDFISFLREIHISSLNQLYDYIMKIYTNFNLIHPGSTRNNGDIITDVSAFLVNEEMYETNKKKLILNHFLTLIDAQFNASIISYVPSMTPDKASSIGKVLIENDYTVNLKDYITPQTDAAVIEKQDVFLDFLAQYISFIQAYTSYLGVKNIKTGFNQYSFFAEKIKSNTMTSKMIPSMFFYDEESMRSIRFIPAVSATVQDQSLLIPWASEIVKVAEEGRMSNNHPIAYFTDATGQKTKNKVGAQKLFLLIEAGPILLEQELLGQPQWMNTQQETLRVLSGALGDFSALVNMGIIDSTLESVIKKATKGQAQKTSLVPSKKALPQSLNL